jgi:hypothetical protein
MIFTLWMFLFELLVMFYKHHFYNGLVSLGLLLLVINNFFGRTYNKFIIKLTAGGIILDLIWLIVHAQVIFRYSVELLVSIRSNYIFYFEWCFFEVDLPVSNLITDTKSNDKYNSGHHYNTIS